MSLSDQQRILSPISSLPQPGLTSDGEAANMQPTDSPRAEDASSTTPPPLPIRSNILQAFDATIEQRTLIFEQLRQAEAEAREALFTLLLLEQEAKLEEEHLQACINKAAKKFSKKALRKIFREAEANSKEEWEEQWRQQWMDTDGEEDPSSQKNVSKPAPVNEEENDESNPDSDPEISLDPAEIVEPAEAAPAQDEEPAVEQKAEIRVITQGVPLPVKFFQHFGPSSLRPNPPPAPKTRRLRREYMRVMRPTDGSDPVLVDMRETMAAHRDETRAKIDAHRRKDLALDNDLWAIDRPSRDHPMHVDWRDFHEEFGVPRVEDEAENPFAPREPVAGGIDFSDFTGF